MNKNRVVKWHTDDQDPHEQLGVEHVCIDGSDLICQITAYKTKEGSVAVLQKYKEGFCFRYISQMLRSYGPAARIFKTEVGAPHSAIRKAILAGRHVYGFGSAKAFFKHQGKMLNSPTKFIKTF